MDNSKQKTISIYFGKKNSAIVRAIAVLVRREGISESDFFKLLLKQHAEKLKLYTPPTGKEQGKWYMPKIEKLEAQFPPENKEKRLSEEAIEGD